MVEQNITLNKKYKIFAGGNEETIRAVLTCFGNLNLLSSFLGKPYLFISFYAGCPNLSYCDDIPWSISNASVEIGLEGLEELMRLYKESQREILEVAGKKFYKDDFEQAIANLEEVK